MRCGGRLLTTKLKGEDSEVSDFETFLIRVTLLPFLFVCSIWLASSSVQPKWATTRSSRGVMSCGVWKGGGGGGEQQQQQACITPNQPHFSRDDCDAIHNTRPYILICTHM